MPSRENKTIEENKQSEIADDALIERRGMRVFQTKRRRTWLAVLLCVLAVPVVLTLISALTSPPHVSGVPSGHLITLQADAPSEHTTTLRGMFVSGPDGSSRLLAHETEPQDTDDGVREWITQPILSPDGTQLAFEKQLITLQEDKQAIDNQIWVMPLTADTRNPPHLVMDLTKQKLKQIVGLAWDSDSSLLFLEDGASYSVATETDDAPLVTPLDLHGLTLAKSNAVSATRSPALTEAGTFAYGVQTPSGPQILTQVQERTTPGPAAAIFALSPDGNQIAFVPPGVANVIRLYNIATHAYGPDIPVHWGWSVFGKREITSLRWSPDGSQLAFTVSKPPVPDDEIFVVTPATGKTVQLPYRTGRAAWDWGK
jgi:WD40 repeat protein